MKPNAGLINCARGGVVCEIDLVDALNNKTIAYAGVDVFEKEPPLNMDILQHNNVSLSPHIGGSTKEAQNRIGIELAEKVIEFFRN
jgi:D-3-phosphoglycerate dehydrogenase